MKQKQAATATQSGASKNVVVLMQHVNKWFGQFHVLRDINLTVEKGERIVVCGPSGSGKSKLIRCLNRLERHQDGDITVHGIELNNDVKNIDEIRHEVGMVFQYFNLFRIYRLWKTARWRRSGCAKHCAPRPKKPPCIS